MNKFTPLKREPDVPAFLMCAPEFFEIAYEINPWMSVRRQTDHPLAIKQWNAYHELLTKKLKVQVELIKPVKELPDMVFTANAGVVQKNVFVRSNFRHKERKGEEKPFETWFRYHGYTVRTVEEYYSFEGEGDALFMGPELFTGFHFRSDVEAHDQLSAHFNITYLALELRDKRFYHLDTCFMPLDEKSALMFLPAFETYAQLVLLETVADPILVPEEEALRFACNALAVGKTVVMPDGCPKTKRELELRGFTVHALDFSEFIKAGGAAKCLILKI